jgi:uncharacterized protein YqfA (UPF0365 family)
MTTQDDSRIDEILGLVRVIAEDQIDIRAKLATQQAQLDTFLAEHAANSGAMRVVSNEQVAMRAKFASLEARVDRSRKVTPLPFVKPNGGEPEDEGA